MEGNALNVSIICAGEKERELAVLMIETGLINASDIMKEAMRNMGIDHLHTTSYVGIAPTSENPDETDMLRDEAMRLAVEADNLYDREECRTENAYSPAVSLAREREGYILGFLRGVSWEWNQLMDKNKNTENE